jgi:hypothetical protein
MMTEAFELFGLLLGLLEYLEAFALRCLTQAIKTIGQSLTLSKVRRKGDFASTATATASTCHGQDSEV